MWLMILRIRNALDPDTEAELKLSTLDQRAQDVRAHGFFSIRTFFA
jgi:hypothetical protein